MGTASCYNSPSESNGKVREINAALLVLNVYDLTPVNNYLYWFGFGIYHSGIEVHGKEYGYGAHDFPASGVFEVEPRKCPGFTFRCSISLGQINMHASEFRTFLENLTSNYHGDRHHLISKNCNHFSDDVSYRLTGKRIPGWVNRLAKLAVCFLKAFNQQLLNNPLNTTNVQMMRRPLSTATSRNSIEIEDEQEKKLLAGTKDRHFIKEAHSST